MKDSIMRFLTDNEQISVAGGTNELSDVNNLTQAANISQLVTDNRS